MRGFGFDTVKNGFLLGIGLGAGALVFKYFADTLNKQLPHGTIGPFSYYAGDTSNTLRPKYGYRYRPGFGAGSVGSGAYGTGNTVGSPPVYRGYASPPSTARAGKNSRVAYSYATDIREPNLTGFDEVAEKQFFTGGEMPEDPAFYLNRNQMKPGDVGPGPYSESLWDDLLVEPSFYTGGEIPDMTYDTIPSDST